MRNKNGFTLVELLAAIVIIGILAILAIPAFTQIYSSVRQSNRNAKIQEIEKAAEKYGSKIKDEIKDCWDGKSPDGVRCKTQGSSYPISLIVDGDTYFGAEALIMLGYMASDQDGSNVIIDPMYNRPLSANVYLTYCKSKYDIEANYIEEFASATVYFAGDKVGTDAGLYNVNITYKPSRPYDASLLQEGDTPCPTPTDDPKKAKNFESCRQRPTVDTLNQFRNGTSEDLSVIKNSMGESFFTPFSC